MAKNSARLSLVLIALILVVLAGVGMGEFLLHRWPTREPSTEQIDDYVSIAKKWRVTSLLEFRKRVELDAGGFHYDVVFSDRGVPLDGWDREFEIKIVERSGSVEFSIRSLGPDGVHGSADDMIRRRKYELTSRDGARRGK